MIGFLQSYKCLPSLLHNVSPRPASIPRSLRLHGWLSRLATLISSGGFCRQPLSAPYLSNKPAFFLLRPVRYLAASLYIGGLDEHNAQHRSDAAQTCQRGLAHGELSKTLFALQQFLHYVVRVLNCPYRYCLRIQSIASKCLSCEHVSKIFPRSFPEEDVICA